MTEPLELRGRCAVITGAASGIGRSMAREAARRGMDLALADVDAVGLETLAAELRDMQANVLIHPLDVRSAEAVASFADAVFARFDSIALVFANAGLLRVDSAIRPDLDVWNLTLDVNLRGVVHTVAAFLGRMIDRGQPAQFVITASQAAFVIGPTIAAYAASKHALWAYADTIRMELAQDPGPVGVSLLAPGRVHSGLTMQTAERVRAAQGEEAVKAYETLLMPSDVAGRFAIEQAAARRFWILPADDYHDNVRARFDSLLNPAEPHPSAN
jgi:NADP-dependent 3-hydroxy acid dehydrogenase YdfG